MRITSNQTDILCALARGCHLKNHRYLDGTKVSCLHDANGEIVSTVAVKDVKRLQDCGLIASNMKFPASVYMLTERGANYAAAITQISNTPLSARLPHRPKP